MAPVSVSAPPTLIKVAWGRPDLPLRQLAAGQRSDNAGVRLRLLIGLLLVTIAGASYYWWRRAQAAPRGLVRHIPATALTFPQVMERHEYRAVPLLRRLHRPLFLTHAKDGSGRIFVVEQDGRILVYPSANAPGQGAVFLDIKRQVRRQHMEEGLLGLAFAPDHARSGRFYIYYSASQPRRTVLSRYAVQAGRVGAEEVLLEIGQPYGNHNGGMIEFGPDGMLYVAVGDGGSGGDPHGHGQNKNTLLATILRLDVSSDEGYAVPRDNPFVGEDDARPEIWAFGLRNVWRFSFDARGRLWAGDVGQNRVEEIDLVSKGGNYGWRVYEGKEPYSGWKKWRQIGVGDVVAPVHEYKHAPIASVTGGYVYRGQSAPDWRGRYVFGDFVSGQIWTLTDRNGRAESVQEVANVPNLASFGEDEAGELYAVSLSGSVYRFERRARQDTPSFPQRLSETGMFLDTKLMTPVRGLLPYSVNHPFWSDGATKKRWMALPAGAKIEFSKTGAWTFPVGTVFVKHFEWPAAPKPRRLETRVFLRGRDGWAGYTYKWTDDQSDAVLLEDALDEAIPVEGAPVWHYPSRQECMSCHTEAAGFVLGVRTRQLNRDQDYGDAVQHQIAAWSRVGLFAQPVKNVTALPRYPAAPEGHLEDDDDTDNAARARAYLDVNCAMCHAPGGPAPGEMDLRFDTPLDDMRLIGALASQAKKLRPGERRVVAGHAAGSLLWQSVAQQGERHMPPVSSDVIDQHGAALLARWIDAMESK